MGTSTNFTQYPAESRVGRENQVYDENSVRQVSFEIERGSRSPFADNCQNRLQVVYLSIPRPTKY